MTRYAWRDRFRAACKPDVFARCIEEIRGANTGVTPQAVVDAARPRNSPIHRLFNWDDSAAAEAYRRAQAGLYLRSYRIVYIGSDKVRRYRIANVVVGGEDSSAYVDTMTAMSDAGMRAQVLEDAMTQLRGLRVRYAHLIELSEIFEAIDAVSQKRKARRKERRTG